ncbi:MAG: metallophosphoesterase [Bacteroidales bacterium]|jgi:Icc protein|nr:metallophosphoesterase [Bacteroidales bacterium]
MKIALKILLLISIFINVACESMFDYSSYVIDFEGKDKDVHQTNIDRLLRKDGNDTIRIAFTGDSHRFYDELEDFVNAVNSLNENNPIDFVVHVGDISDFGLPQQYLWGNSYLLNLDYPYFVVLGNHDLVGNGGMAYNEMFGEFNFSFIYQNIKFVFVNTNSREFNFNGNVPNINWLNVQLQPGDDFENAIVIFHVPPMDGDCDPRLEEDFHSAIAKYDNVIFTIHGHSHNHEIYTPYVDSIPYINVYGVQYEKFNIINIIDDTFEIETCNF